MKIFLRHKRKIAIFFLILTVLELYHPDAFALTSGPGQPEFQGFEPAAVTDMVDLFTGDFHYNIPLMDVGGYPLNLVYHSGMGVEDESSWVGFGWSLTPGSINRQLRGLPDDFSGVGLTGEAGDSMLRTVSRRPEVRAGLGGKVKAEFLGIPGKRRKNRLAASISTEIYNDNYWGIGAQIGANAGLSLGLAGSGYLTAGLGIRSDSRSGVDVTPTLNFSIYSNAEERNATHLGMSVGFPYNSRAGLRNMTLGQTIGFKKNAAYWGDIIRNTSISFAGQAYTPQIPIPTKTRSFTASADIGPAAVGIYAGAGVSGDYFEESLLTNVIKNPAYGYMYADHGKDDRSAMMDLNREKDGPYIKEDPYLPVPVNTYDLYSLSSQFGSSQFRAMRGSSGVLFDPQSRAISADNSIGAELGFGIGGQVGIDLYHQSIDNTTGKWADNNDYARYADYSAYNAGHPDREPVYFKSVGEAAPRDDDYAALLRGDDPQAVTLSKSGNEGKAEASFRDRHGSLHTVNAPLQRAVRNKRNTTITYLTAAEATKTGLNKFILSYPYNTLTGGYCNTPQYYLDRVSEFRNAHHISQISVTDDQGMRTVYGLPVYNKDQEEVTFSVDGGGDANRASGQISYAASGPAPDNSITNGKGRDHYFSKESMPPYATSYLLTGILSSDYVDKTGDGITDDDLGTATKFNYTRVNTAYKWRAPFAGSANVATYNANMMSDVRDDKASYIYGEKELWYMHSIESKTMIAQFILQDRQDALGVANENGAKATAVHQQLLKEIRLYSKSDLAHPGAVPIKTVHFVYNYHICQGLPNSASGKLTLERVYFTFGANNKGKLHPYVFAYNDGDTTVSSNHYQLQCFDRWGTFKDSASNPNGLLNSEYPYTLQDSALAAGNAGKWQLSEITLPTGGVIQVNYESDDYAYVQNKRAMQMFLVKNVNGSTAGEGLITAPYIEVGLPDGVTDVGQLSEGIDYLYFKCLVDLDSRHREFVPGYAKVKNFVLSEDKRTLRIYFDMASGDPNPIAKAAWQFFRTNLPQYVYPGYENLSPDRSNFSKAIMALKGALTNLREITENFNERARRKRYADKLTPGKSWVRLCSPFYKKLGGGSRVKAVELSDQWQSMSGATGAISSAYGQEYQYTTNVKNRQGQNMEISSGVASYEPLLGNDENPFRQPVFYSQKVPFALTTYYYKELPMCETYYPGPVIGYSKVVVRNTGANGTNDKTGYTLNEFYTAKDFPTVVESTPIKTLSTQSSFILRLLKAEVRNGVTVSQGYSVKLNDMHGKPKLAAIYDQGGARISSEEYTYKTVNPAAETQELENTVDVLKSDGTIGSAVIGEDIDMVSDMREQYTTNIGSQSQWSAGIIPIFFFPIFYAFPGGGVNSEYKSFNAASTVKVIHQYGVLQKVTKMQQGSTIRAENLLWDGQTGEVLLTKTQNEFDDPVYSFSYPAWWAYPGMGQAFANEGMYIHNFYSDYFGQILINGSSSSLRDYISPGDEILDINTGYRYWISRNGSGFLRVIDQSGNLVTLNTTVKILRSGRRNLITTKMGSLVSLVNPIRDGKVDPDVMSEVLDAKATVYKEDWPIPAACATCDSGYEVSSDGTLCFREVTGTQVDTFRAYTIYDSVYTQFGTYIYDPGFCSDGVTNFSRTRILDFANDYWGGKNHPGMADTTANGNCSPNTLMGMASGSIKAGKAGNDTTTGSGLKSTSSFTPMVTFYATPLNRCGIWTTPSGPDYPPYNTWIGIAQWVYFPDSTTYYFGVGADNAFKASVDEVYFVEYEGNGDESFKIWHVFPVKLAPGYHRVSIEGKNLDSGSKGGFGMEIYHNTREELLASGGPGGVNIIFSTAEYVGKPYTTNYSCPSGAFPYSEDSVIGCRYVAQRTAYVNPYVEGIWGNWRAQRQYVYQVDRLAYDTSATAYSRKAGYYTAFDPFWNYDAVQTHLFVPDTTNWTWSSEITHYNRKGMETEEKDALGRYSAALFGYNESTPVMVASNSREKDLVYDGFEDYAFKNSCLSICLGINAADFSPMIDHVTVDTVAGIAHTGNYSLKLDGMLSIDAPLTPDTAKEGMLYSFDYRGRLVPLPVKRLRGFEPSPGQQYLISFWINDGSNVRTTGFQIKVNGVNQLASGVQYPLVEGWKRVEAVFTAIDDGGGLCELELNSGGNTVYLDDIRIHPYAGDAKTFAYDARSLRLMAGLDENNFATFYEYDDEGTLIRVKKETERGIVTVKETRSSYKLNP